MGEKISAQTETTTPSKTDEMVLVSGGNTRKATIQNALETTLGWFDVGEDGAAQTSLGNGSDIQILVDAADSNQGGYANLPHGISSSDVYDAGNSRIKLGWLDGGESILMRVSGDITTSANTTAVTFTFKFFDSSDSEVFTLSDSRYYKTAGTYPFSIVLPIWISSTLASDGYVQVYANFDAGSGNAIDMGGFFVSVLS